MGIEYSEHPLDNKPRQRFCGYCNMSYDSMNHEDYMTHLDMCEEFLVKFLKKTNDKKS